MYLFICTLAHFPLFLCSSIPLSLSLPLLAAAEEQEPSNVKCSQSLVQSELYDS